MLVHHVTPDVTVLNDCLPVPGLGFLPVNAFVLHAAEPVVVDTGVGLPGRGFLDALATAVAPEDVRWIWLTHPDRDHTGAPHDLLEAAPRALVVTTFLGMGIMSTERPLPPDRVRIVNPGERLDVGDRTLAAFRPPLFDNPATVGFLDTGSGACFSSDCCGAPLPAVEDASVPEIGDSSVRDAQLLWAAVDSPWVHLVNQDAYLATIRPLRDADPPLILSSHLPPARDRSRDFFDTLALAPMAPAFTGPDQEALTTLLKSFEPAAP
ncbi:MBL fold metallo-hydrolase [Thermoactinospora rubra]|uniref:MBL fold metallo-hydrolase n=1 Tax=Thermoactinospora rubra TaxID=1088767 RepID=UPI000A0F7CEE|nr:MBL fold metallo-hydrolase [Thermoactinospora rubra]